MPDITLTDGSTTLPLPGDLEWSDEYDWEPVIQTAEYSLTGALVVESAARLAGRPITLEGRENAAWVTRADVDTLRAWSAVPGQELTLTLADEREIEVLFRHQDAPAITARPVMFSAPMEAGDAYILTLKLMEI